MDDIRPPRGSMGPTPTNYGRAPSASQPPLRSTPPAPSVQTTAQQEQVHPTEDYSLQVAKKPGKLSKVLLIVFIILFALSGAFAAWQYMQVKDLQTQVDELQKENQRLNERVYSLNYDNRDLNQKIELLTTENEALREINKKLLETCGNACSSIIP